MKNTETMEGPQQIIYSRSLIKCDLPVVNRYAQADMEKLDVWNSTTVDLILSDKGSIRKLHDLVKEKPELYPSFKMENIDRLRYVQQKYKTMWELSQRVFLKMAADRGRYICQSQSTNIYLDDPTDKQLIAIHRYTNRLGLKTGMYYLRRLAGGDPIKFTVSPDIANYVDTYVKVIESAPVCRMENGCINCSS